MKYIISGGGTGGHIYPALAIVEELKKRDENSEFLYVGLKDSLESELAKTAELDFVEIRAKGLPRKVSIKGINSLFQIFLGILDSRKILKKFNPDIVIGTGGYVCAPMLYAAQMMKYKTFIQEQNALPGKTNRLLAKKADAVAISFDESRKHFKIQDNLVLTGNPIRHEFYVDVPKKERNGLPLILSFGGSGGQESTNKAVLDMLNSNDELPFKLIHITGKSHYDEFIKQLKNKNDNISILAYSHEIPDLLKKSELVIASSSAMTLAEISALSLPSILIPKAYTAGNHQYHNAISYRDSCASKVLLEEDLTGDLLLSTILELIEDEELLKEMGMNSKRRSKNISVQVIADEIYHVINKQVDYIEK